MKASYRPYSQPSFAPQRTLTSANVPAWVSEVGLEWLYELMARLEVR